MAALNQTLATFGSSLFSAPASPVATPSPMLNSSVASGSLF
jgi:hypothetical protein